MNWKRTILTWIVFFGAFLLISQWFTKKQDTAPVSTGSFIVSSTDSEYSVDEEVIITLRNNTDKPVTIPLSCPKNPFKVLVWDGSQYVEKTAETKVNCALVTPVTIQPGKKENISFTYWNHALFGTPGRYKIEVPISLKDEEESKVFSTEEFVVEKKGTFGLVWNTVFFQPLYNGLIFLISIVPFRDLGLAIILLTLLIRVILLIPSQRAIEAQRRMQELQPKLDALKKKHAGNQEKIGVETMALWKKEKVSPFGSCLPLIIQFPVLIALYYVIQSGLNPDNAFMLYGGLKNFDFHSIHSNFLGILDLTKVNAYVLPLVVGLLQFAQMKLAVMKKAAVKTEGDGVPKDSELQQANKMMTYVMPVMIALFTASVPAGVGLYWAVSTVFGIGQQFVANRAVTKHATIA